MREERERQRQAKSIRGRRGGGGGGGGHGGGTPRTYDVVGNTKGTVRNNGKVELPV